MKRISWQKLIAFVAGLSLSFTTLAPDASVFAHTGDDGGECSAENIIVNGSFEEPVVVHGSKWNIFGPTITGWEAQWRSDIPATYGDWQRPDPQIELQRGVGGWLPQDGEQFTELDTDWVGPNGGLNGEPGSIKLWQDVATISGAQYEISFYTSPRPGVNVANNKTEIKWGSTILDTIIEDGTGEANTVWTNHAYEVIATGSTMQLMFTDLGIANSLGAFIDNITVNRVCKEEVCEFEEEFGWYGEYFNYLTSHPEMNLNSSLWPDVGHGDPMSANTSWTTDWYTQPYYRYWQIDSDLNFGENFFPFDSAPEEITNSHDYHFGAHWTSRVIAPEAGDYNFSLRTDDDAWLYLDGVLIADNSGIHPPFTVNGLLSLGTIPKTIDVYFAERHTVRSHMALTFEDERLIFMPVNPDCEEDEPREPPVIDVEKTGEYDFEAGQMVYSIDWELDGTGLVENVEITDVLPGGTTFYSADNGGIYELSTNTVTWSLGDLMAPNSDTVMLTVWLDDAFATSVESVDQGTRNNGTPVIAERSIATNALYAPQSAGLPGDTPGFPVDEWFFSLGFAGEATTSASAEIVLAFDTPAFNGPCADIRVYEVTYTGPYPDEMAKVEASNDLTNWEDLGTVSRDGTVALPNSMQSAKYIRLTNMSDPELFEPLADGYDVDAVQALHPSICYISNTAEIVGIFHVTSETTVDLQDEDTFGSVINENVCIPELYIDKEGEFDVDENVITYTIDWQVIGLGTLYDVVVEDEVPTGTTYVEDSASDPDDAGPLEAGSESAGVVSWQLGTQVAGSGGTLSFEVTVDSAEAWVDYVVSVNQGKRKDGTPVLLERSNPDKALGEAENDDTLNFFSLGFGEEVNEVQYGELILGFDNYILNGPGADIEVVETSYGSPSDAAYPETVELFVSQNGSTWVSLGTGIQDEMFSFENGSTVFEWARYVKLVDCSDKSKFGSSSTTDGYDVDGVRAIYSAPGECSIDNHVFISGETTDNELWQIFSPDVEAEATTTTEINPIACEPPVEDVTIIARKIVCDLEDLLPNWGNGGPNIDADTAQNWVDTHEGCRFVSDWDFQWGPQNSYDPGDVLIGPANAPWETMPPTDINGETSVTLTAEDIGDNSYLWFREVLKKEYIPFTHDQNNNSNVDDVSAELYCNTDVLNYDNYDRIDGITLGQTYYCVGFNVLSESPAGMVTGMKFNDHDSNGEKDSGDEGLEGWKIYAGKLVDTVEVYAQSDREDGNGETVQSNVVLESGKEYFIRASGTFTAGDSITADAMYSIRTGPEWTDLVENYGGYGVQLLDLWIYSDYSLWGSYNSEHVYWYTMTGTGNTIGLHIYDIYAFNNDGYLTVQIYEVLAEDVTDENGDYTLDIPAELIGDIVIAEETQVGWVQTYPMPEGYHIVPADGVTESIDFGNHDILDEGDEPGDDDPGDGNGDNDGGDEGGVEGQGDTGGGGGTGGAPGPSYEEPGDNGSGDDDGDDGFGAGDNEGDAVGGGDITGDEEVAGDTTGGDSAAGSGTEAGGSYTGSGDDDDEGQTEILGNTVDANDLEGDEEDTGTTGNSGWRVFGIVFVSLFLILLIIYVIYRWLRSKGDNIPPTPGI